MKFFEKGDEKVQKICDALRRETLEPAKHEADGILTSAAEQRERILREAEAEAKAIVAKGRAQLDHEQQLFKISMAQAAKQGIELLKQQIEKGLFNPALTKLVDESTSNPNVVAQLINSIVQALERDGMAADITAVVAKTVSADEVNKLLLKDVLKRLKEKGIVVGQFAGGAKVRLEGKKVTLDMSDEALKELLTTFLRDHFRSYFFTT